MVGRNTPENVAMQMGGFAISGCGDGLKKTQGGMYQLLIVPYVVQHNTNILRTSS